MIEQYMNIVASLAEYYDKPLSANQIEMYAKHLAILSPEQLNAAIQKYQSDPENAFFPLPAVLIAMIKPECTEIDFGREVAGRIIQATGKFGYPNPKEARAFIGELGWKVVERQGGWQNLCAELNQDNKGILQAQMRDLAVSLMRMAENGTLDEPIGLPGPRGEAATIGEITQKLLKGTKDE